MNHSEVEFWLWDYYDGELPPEKRRQVESHLQACAECRHALDAWRQLSSHVFPTTDVPASGDTERFVQRVMARIDSDEPAAAVNWLDLLSSRWLVPALGAGLAAAILLTAPMTRSQDPVDAMLQQEGAGESLMSWISGPPPSSADAFSIMSAGARE